MTIGKEFSRSKLSSNSSIELSIIVLDIVDVIFW